VEHRGRGRPAYAPGDLLRLYIYGYLHRVSSSRKLEAETGRNVEVMWLLRRLRPDFKTIARFRQENGAAIQRVTAAFVQFCQSSALLLGGEVALDGSKVAGQNARHRNYSAERLRKRLKHLEAQMHAYLRRLDVQDGEEAHSELALPADAAPLLAALQSRHQKAMELLAQLEASGAEQLSLTDADAKRMKTGMGAWVVGHNAQVAVDTETHLVVHLDIEDSGNDRQALAPMAQQTQQILGGGPLRMLADGGYSSAEHAAVCEANQIEVTAPRQHSVNRHGNFFDKREFRYDAERDEYTCPAGEILSFRSQQGSERVYRTKACRNCPLRDRCTDAKSRYRIVTRHAQEPALERMDARAKASPETMVKRKSTVEHVFGTLKYLLGGRFLTRGRAGAKTELALAVLGYNFKRLINLKGVPWLMAQMT
jgi:transposase